MATSTVPVRFEFQCEKTPDKLKFTHNVPSNLVTADPLAAQNPQYMQQFSSIIEPIVGEHEAVCRTASSPKCQSCGSATTKVLMTPMSWLHVVQDPFVTVWVNAVCGKPTCEIMARQKIQDMMQMLSSSPEAQEVAATNPSLPTAIMEITKCNFCGNMENIMKCSRCLTVAYCSKEHQREDWKVHKSMCRSSAR